MLYLAEVQKKTGVFSGGKAELKLLACQRGEHSWTPVPGEEIISADEASNFNSGALVFVELSANKQVQKPPQEAARQLVSILQNFSRGQDKLKTKEEEIEQWMQSLTYQSQELQRREMELQAREEELAGLESQRQEIESASEEAKQKREELERQQQELENSWQQLRGEKQDMEQQLTQVQQSVQLDETQATHIQELLDYLAGTSAPTESLHEQLNLSLELLAAQQSVLDEHWQRVEQQRNDVQQHSQEVEAKTQELENRWQQWREAQSTLEQTRSELKVQETTLTIKQEYAQSLETQLRTQEQLHEQLSAIAPGTVAPVNVTTDKVDVQALERMPVEELQGLVQNLEQEYSRDLQFVNSQEEELNLQRETIDELQNKLGQATDSERWKLQRELTDEQEAYEMLQKTLEGQLNNLRQRQQILTQHKVILSRQLGNGSDIEQPANGLEPFLEQIEAQRQQISSEYKKLETQIEQLQQEIEQKRETIDRQTSELEARYQELEQIEAQLVEQRAKAAEFSGRVSLYEEMLQPIQDKLSELKQKLEEVVGTIGHVNQTGDHQQQAIAQMRDLLMSLINGESQELAAS